MQNGETHRPKSAHHRATMGLSRYTGLQGTIKPTDTRENSCFFCVCVNLIIQIFIYTVRKNLLIFISSQAPRGPTTNTHPACLLHTTVQVEAAIAAPAFTQGNKGKERQGRGGGSACFSEPWQPHHPLLLGLRLNLGRCLFSRPFPTLATLRPHQLSCLGSF